jgi:general secretion pathway protein G
MPLSNARYSMSIKNYQIDKIYACIRGGRRIKHRGFTLLELIVTIVIVGILSAIAVPLYQGYADKSKFTTACMDIQNISVAIGNYYTDHGQYPNSLTDVGYATLLDPWGNPYVYVNLSTAPPGKSRKDHFLVPINTDYDLCSMGKDGKTVAPLTAKDSRDDIIRANDGAYIGLASDY